MNNEQNNQNLETLYPVTPPTMDPDNISNPTVLGNVGNVNPPVEPLPPVEEINLQPVGVAPLAETNNTINNNGVEPLISTPLTSDTNLNNFGTEQNQVNNQTFNQMGMNVQPQPFDMNQNMMPNNQFDYMGGVPTPPPLPTEEKKEKKKGNNKILLVLLIVVLIAGVGYGLYYFLIASKAKVNVVITPTKMEVELGEKLDLKSASNFATVTGYDINNCTVDTDLNTSKYGTYQYSITCGALKSKAQTIIVRDTTSPVVILKDVIVIPNKVIEAEDFFEDIIDNSLYTVNFNEETVDTSTPGTYEVAITVSDEYENKTEVKGKLIVDENAPTTFLQCSKEEEGTNPVISLDFIFGISGNGNRYGAEKLISLVYKDEESYKKGVTEFEEFESIDGIRGPATFNQNEYTINFKTIMTDEELTKEFTKIPTTEDEIQTVFNDNCELKLN